MALKAAYAGLLTLLSEAARLHADSESFRSTLDDAGVSGDRAGQLVSYGNAVALIRDNLRTDTLGVPALLA